MKNTVHSRAIAFSLACAALLSGCVVQPVAPGAYVDPAPVYVDPGPVYAQPYPGVVYAQPYGVAPSFGWSLNYSQRYGGYGGDWHHRDYGAGRGGRYEGRYQGRSEGRYQGRPDGNHEGGHGGRREGRPDRRHDDH